MVHTGFNSGAGSYLDSVLQRPRHHQHHHIQMTSSRSSMDRRRRRGIISRRMTLQKEIARGGPLIWSSHWCNAFRHVWKIHPATMHFQTLGCTFAEYCSAGTTLKPSESIGSRHTLHHHHRCFYHSPRMHSSSSSMPHKEEVPPVHLITSSKRIKIQGPRLSGSTCTECVPTCCLRAFPA